MKSKTKPCKITTISILSDDQDVNQSHDTGMSQSEEYVKVYTLPGNLSWGIDREKSRGDKGKGDKCLFVRKSDQVLCDEIEKSFKSNPEKTDKHIVIGNSGIGKTFRQAHFLYMFATKHPEVTIILHMDKDSCYELLPDGSAKWHKEAFDHKSDRRDVVYLRDAKEDFILRQDESHVFTVYTTSPSPNQWTSFDKTDGARKCYTSMYTLAQLRAIKPFDLGLKELTEDELKERFETIGGNLRQLRKSKAEYKRFRKEVENIGVSDAVKCVLFRHSMPAKVHEVSHKIMELVPLGEDFSDFYYRCVSPRVKKRLYQQIGREHFNDLLNASKSEAGGSDSEE